MPKRILQGVVTSDKNEQTITVLVERRFKHPLLHKTVRKYQEIPGPRRREPVQDRRYRPNRGMCADLEDETLDGGGRSFGLISSVFTKPRGSAP